MRDDRFPVEAGYKPARACFHCAYINTERNNFVRCEMWGARTMFAMTCKYFKEAEEDKE
jgi:hypothetical protein